MKALSLQPYLLLAPCAPVAPASFQVLSLRALAYTVPFTCYFSERSFLITLSDQGDQLLLWHLFILFCRTSPPAPPPPTSLEVNMQSHSSLFFLSVGLFLVSLFSVPLVYMSIPTQYYFVFITFSLQEVLELAFQVFVLQHCFFKKWFWFFQICSIFM